MLWRNVLGNIAIRFVSVLIIVLFFLSFVSYTVYAKDYIYEDRYLNKSSEKKRLTRKEKAAKVKQDARKKKRLARKEKAAKVKQDARKKKRLARKEKAAKVKQDARKKKRLTRKEKAAKVKQDARKKKRLTRKEKIAKVKQDTRKKKRLTRKEKIAKVKQDDSVFDTEILALKGAEAKKNISNTGVDYGLLNPEQTSESIIKIQPDIILDSLLDDKLNKSLAGTDDKMLEAEKVIVRKTTIFRDRYKLYLNFQYSGDLLLSGAATVNGQIGSINNQNKRERNLNVSESTSFLGIMAGVYRRNTDYDQFSIGSRSYFGYFDNMTPRDNVFSIKMLTINHDYRVDFEGNNNYFVLGLVGGVINLTWEKDLSKESSIKGVKQKSYVLGFSIGGGYEFFRSIDSSVGVEYGYRNLFTALPLEVYDGQSSSSLPFLEISLNNIQMFYLGISIKIN